MIDYSALKVGDKLRIVGQGAPGFARLGDVVEVTKTGHNRCDVVNQHGESAYFALTCGAARLEMVELSQATPAVESVAGVSNS